jgi:hypothetical protein
MYVPCVFLHTGCRYSWGKCLDENGEWRRLHSEDLHSLYLSPSTTRTSTSLTTDFRSVLLTAFFLSMISVLFSRIFSTSSSYLNLGLPTSLLPYSLSEIFLTSLFIFTFITCPNYSNLLIIFSITSTAQGTRMLNVTFTTGSLITPSCAESIQFLALTPITLRSILSFSSNLRLDLPRGLFRVGVPTNTFTALLSSSIVATCSAVHVNYLDLMFRVF